MNKITSFLNQFFICIACNINLCPLFKSIHNKFHDIMDYNQKYYICNLHNEKYNSYCDNCKTDICLICEKSHLSHKLISYGGIVPDQKELKGKLKIFRNKINEFKNEIKDIMTKLNF